jgi:pimeloyl-ACP methyl ester carboxylesterase
LFAPLVNECSGRAHATVVAYPRDAALGLDALVAYVRDAAPREPFVLIAESYSGPAAIAFAATAPPQLRGLVLVASFAAQPLPPWARAGARLGAGLAMLLRRPFAPLIRRVLLGRAPPPALARALDAALRAVPPAVLARRIRDCLRWDVRARLSDVRVPTLALHAGQDRILGTGAAASLLGIPRLETLTLPGPHLLLQREPAATAAAILAFAQRWQKA